MSSTAEVGLISFIIPVMSLCMLTVKPVIFGIHEIAAIRFKLIPSDTDEWSFKTKYMYTILLAKRQKHHIHQTAYSHFAYNILIALE